MKQGIAANEPASISRSWNWKLRVAEQSTLRIGCAVGKRNRSRGQVSRKVNNANETTNDRAPIAQ